MQNETEDKRISIRVDAKTHKLIKKEALKRDITVSQFMMETILWRIEKGV